MPGSEMPPFDHKTRFSSEQSSYPLHGLPNIVLTPRQVMVSDAPAVQFSRNPAGRPAELVTQQLCHVDGICLFPDLVERHASTEANPVAKLPHNKAEHDDYIQDHPTEEAGDKQPDSNRHQEEENVRYS